MKRKIFFVVSRMHGGGAQRVMIHLLNYLVEHTKDEVTLILFNSKPQDAYLPLISKKCEIIVLGTSAKFGWYKLSKLIKSRKPDVLFSTLNYINIAAIVATLYAFSKLKLVVREARPVSKTQLFIQKIQKLFYWRVNVFWAITPIIAQEIHTMLKIGTEKIILAPNPIDIKISPSVIDNEQTIDMTTRLLYVGRLIELKNVDLMIRSLALIKELKWHFKIVGTGPLDGELKNLVSELGLSEKIEFIGYSNDPYSFMAESDIFLLASRFEGFPNVVAEALACGNLCIASDTEGGGVSYIHSLVDQLIIADYKNQQEVADLLSYYIAHREELNERKKLSASQAQSLQIENYFDTYMKNIL